MAKGIPLLDQTPAVGNSSFKQGTLNERAEDTKARSVALKNLEGKQETQTNKKVRKCTIRNYPIVRFFIFVIVLITIPLWLFPFLIWACREGCKDEQSDRNGLINNGNDTPVVPPTKEALPPLVQPAEWSTEAVYCAPLNGSDTRLDPGSVNQTDVTFNSNKAIKTPGVYEIERPDYQRGTRTPTATTKKRKSIKINNIQARVEQDQSAVAFGWGSAKQARASDYRQPDDDLIDPNGVINDEIDPSSDSDQEGAPFADVSLSDDDARVYKKEAIRARAFGCMTVADAAGFISSEEERSDSE